MISVNFNKAIEPTKAKIETPTKAKLCTKNKCVSPKSKPLPVVLAPFTAVWANTLSSIVGQVIAYNPPSSTAISSVGYLGTGSITGITATNCNNNSDFMINFNYQI